MTEAGRNAVLDAGPVIHLDELGQLRLLADFAAVRIADTVFREIERHRPGCLRLAEVPFDVVSPTPGSRQATERLCRAFSLDAGETEALSIAREDPRAIFLTDDAAARLAAGQLGMRVHGTIGVLLRGIRRGNITPHQVLQALEEIPVKSTLHVRPSLLSEVVARVREEFGL